MNSLKQMMNEIPVPRERLVEVLRVEGLSKTFQHNTHEVKALQNIDFTLYEGEMIAVMGTSGSGKSTLLNMLSAIDAPTKGQLFVDGIQTAVYQEPQATEFRRDTIGFVFQSFQLLEDLTVADNVAMPLILREEKSAYIAPRVDEVLREVGMTEWRAHYPSELSGGQQQRVAIARALIGRPKIVLADEPTGALDFNTTNTILDLLVHLQQAHRQTMVVVTHDAYVATFADRVLFFHDGQIVAEYTNAKTEADLTHILATFQQIARGEL